jgi:uncharacterized protein (DUF433 family)
MNNAKLIQRSKRILGGTPVFLGTRVPVQTMIDYLGEGKSLNDFLIDFPTVKRRQAIQILELFKKNLLDKSHARAA